MERQVKYVAKPKSNYNQLLLVRAIIIFCYNKHNQLQGDNAI